MLVALAALGFARLAPARSAHYETATLTGGCFWGLQETLRQIPGVIKTTAGYTGGTVPNPTYELVHAGGTGHAEAVEVVFDPAQLSYAQLLTDFLTLRNPTRVPDSPDFTGRSGIFYHSEAQRQIAERVKAQMDRSGRWSAPVVTEITPATAFYAAEDDQQDYYRKHAGSPSCRLF